MFDLQVFLAGVLHVTDRGIPDPETARAATAEEGVVNINASDRRWRELLDLDARLSEAKGIRLLTPEARVLLFLTLSGPVPVTSAMQAAGTSYRGFYAVIERLKQAGLVAASKDAQDQRVRRLELNPALKMPNPGR